MWFLYVDFGSVCVKCSSVGTVWSDPRATGVNFGSVVIDSSSVSEKGQGRVGTSGSHLCILSLGKDLVEMRVAPVC
jgi:hypothetical protein